eukprot:3633827-Pleurochrysis_carterae.AAC.2
MRKLAISARIVIKLASALQGVQLAIPNLHKIRHSNLTSQRRAHCRCARARGVRAPQTHASGAAAAHESRARGCGVRSAAANAYASAYVCM